MAEHTFRVGIIGLGLIGGSFARAYRAAGHRVYVRDRDAAVCAAALAEGAADGTLDDAEQSGQPLDVLMIALYPEATVECFRALAEAGSPLLGSGTLVMDTCGVKRAVCAACAEIAAAHGLRFLGGHPMAGSHHSGFAASRADLFCGASMILVPPEEGAASEMLLAQGRALTAPLGFGRVTVCSAERHDAMIAFTSQLAHVVSNAYVKSPTAREYVGFSAGSYRDLTRVAYLNAPMWTELFLDNRDNLLRELDAITTALGEYRDAIAEGDAARLCTLLEEGKRCKELAH